MSLKDDFEDLHDKVGRYRKIAVKLLTWAELEKGDDSEITEYLAELADGMEEIQREDLRELANRVKADV